MQLSPYDFHMLDLKVKLPGFGEAEAKGKVVRTFIDRDQVEIGIEFAEISPEDVFRIGNFLKTS